MEFGTFLLMQSPDARPASEIYGRAVELAQAAEDLGFRNVWLAEHHFSNYSYISRPTTLAAYLAARTRTIRIGFAVLTVPLQHPLAIAEELVTLDVLSGGRIDAGFGRGYWQYAFDRLGVEREAGRARFDEALDIVLLALDGAPFSYSGRYYDIPLTSLYPPHVASRMPVWVAAQSPDSVRDTIRRGLNVLSGGTVPISTLAAARAQHDALVEEYGRAGVCQIGTQRPVYVSDSAADAREQALRVRWNVRVSVSQRYDFGEIDAHGRASSEPLPDEPPPEQMFDDHMIVGTPDQCVAQLRQIDDALRPDHFNASFWFGDLDQARVLRSMQRFASDVMPAFAPARPTS